MEATPDTLIAAECDAIKEMLLAKNRAYGNSALEPLRVFSRSDPIEQIRVRIDDKLSRIMRGSGEVPEDTEKDLIGYLVLLRIARRMKTPPASAALTSPAGAGETPPPDADALPAEVTPITAEELLITKSWHDKKLEQESGHLRYYEHPDGRVYLSYFAGTVHTTVAKMLRVPYPVSGAFFKGSKLSVPQITAIRQYRELLFKRGVVLASPGPRPEPKPSESDPDRGYRQMLHTDTRVSGTDGDEEAGGDSS